MALREWSAFRVILTWIWSSLALGLVEPLAAVQGRALPAAVSGGLRLILAAALLTMTWKWYRVRALPRTAPERPPT